MRRSDTDDVVPDELKVERAMVDPVAVGGNKLKALLRNERRQQQMDRFTTESKFGPANVFLDRTDSNRIDDSVLVIAERRPDHIEPQKVLGQRRYVSVLAFRSDAQRHGDLHGQRLSISVLWVAPAKKVCQQVT